MILSAATCPCRQAGKTVGTGCDIARKMRILFDEMRRQGLSIDAIISDAAILVVAKAGQCQCSKQAGLPM